MRTAAERLTAATVAAAGGQGLQPVRGEYQHVACGDAGRRAHTGSVALLQP